MLTISSAIRRTETNDGAILLDVQRGQMLCLNPVGSKILELIGAGYDESQIADQVSAAYSADIETVRTDVREFLETLGRHHVVQDRERATGEMREGVGGGTNET